MPEDRMRVEISGPLLEFVRGEARRSGFTVAAVVRSLLRQSMKAEAERQARMRVPKATAGSDDVIIEEQEIGDVP